MLDLRGSIRKLETSTMNKETIHKLTSIFDEEKSIQAQKENIFEQTRLEQENFLHAFQLLCNKVIRPKMQEFKEILSQNGCSSFIRSTNEDLTENGFNSQCNISLEVFADSNESPDGRDKFPHVMFIANKAYCNMIIHESTISPKGAGYARMKNCSYELEDITEAVIEMEILDSLEKILRRA